MPVRSSGQSERRDPRHSPEWHPHHPHPAPPRPSFPHTRAAIPGATHRAGRNGHYRAIPAGKRVIAGAALSLLFPVCWLIFTLIRGAVIGWYPYPFIDVTRLGYAKVTL